MSDRDINERANMSRTEGRTPDEEAARLPLQKEKDRLAQPTGGSAREGVMTGPNEPRAGNERNRVQENDTSK